MQARSRPCSRAQALAAGRNTQRRRVMASAAATELAVTQEMLQAAQQAADAAAAVTKPLFRSKEALKAEIKTDKSPVTEADKEAEKAMRAIVQEALPSHAIFGEEFGFSPGADGKSEFMWVFDPIDGTKAFMTGKPSWGTLIALLHNGTPVLGIIDQPVTKERWIGVQGRQSLLNGEPVKARACSDLAQAYMYSTTPLMFAGATEQAYVRLRDRVASPQYGADCYAFGLLATGFVDLVVEADLKPWDYMALVPIVEGAGGVITDWNDKKLTWHADENGDSISAWSGEVLAAGDRRMHAEALKALDFSLDNPNV